MHWNLARREWRQAGVRPHHEAALHQPADRRRGRRGAARRRPTGPTWVGARSWCAACTARSASWPPSSSDLEPAARVVYVMTDGAALPLALSDLVADLLRATGLLDVTVTAGHAFGGDHEAVNVPSALDVAVRLAGADVVVVGMGPGVVGTASDLGTTAVEAGPILDAASRLGGRADRRRPGERGRPPAPSPRPQPPQHDRVCASPAAGACVGHAAGTAVVRRAATASGRRRSSSRRSTRCSGAAPSRSRPWGGARTMTRGSSPPRRRRVC